MTMTELVETLAAQQSVKHICQRITTQQEATRLWNWIDLQDEPEPLWAIMLIQLPWAFDDRRDPNTIRFEYNYTGGYEFDIGKPESDNQLDIGEYWDSRSDEEGDFWQLCDKDDLPVRCRPGMRSWLLPLAALSMLCISWYLTR